MLVFARSQYPMAKLWVAYKQDNSQVEHLGIWQNLEEARDATMHKIFDDEDYNSVKYNGWLYDEERLPTPANRLLYLETIHHYVREQMIGWKPVRTKKTIPQTTNGDEIILEHTVEITYKLRFVWDNFEYVLVEVPLYTTIQL
jgi:hypothetical protein